MGKLLSMLAESESNSKEFPYTAANFEAVRKRLKALTGINLADSKDSMVYSRISRRVRQLKLGGFEAYLKFVDANTSEHQEFINALTTNLTSFFREKHHFDELRDILSQNRFTGQGRSVSIWCAASSTGEEPYSIAMTAVESFKSFDIPVKIIASDIDSNVLDKAKAGVFKIEQLDAFDKNFKKRFFYRGKGAQAGLVKVLPELQRLISFQRLNLMDTSWDLPKNIDIVFCRNVMIYFDKSTQLDILKKITTHMHDKSLYFAGHSENFSHAKNIIKPLGKTIYQLNGGG